MTLGCSTFLEQNMSELHPSQTSQCHHPSCKIISIDLTISWKKCGTSVWTIGANPLWQGLVSLIGGEVWCLHDTVHRTHTNWPTKVWQWTPIGYPTTAARCLDGRQQISPRQGNKNPTLVCVRTRHSRIAVRRRLNWILHVWSLSRSRRRRGRVIMTAYTLSRKD